MLPFDENLTITIRFARSELEPKAISNETTVMRTFQLFL